MLQIRQICHNFFELCRRVFGRGFLFSWILLALVGSVLRGEEDSTLSVDVNVVNVLATVRNKQGQIVRDLKQEDFKLEEDGRPQAIRYLLGKPATALGAGRYSLSQRIFLARTTASTIPSTGLREDRTWLYPAL
jgi:hypothetical protein